LSGLERADAIAAEPSFRAVVEGMVKAEGDTWAGALVGGRCRRCGTVTVTVKPICPHCWKAGTQEEIALSQHGALYAFTIVRHAAPGAVAPYAIAYVDLPENVRVMVRGDVETIERLSPGSAVVIAVAPLGVDEDGTMVVGPTLTGAARPEAQ
jgi:uncharacterized OB-fold protein